jgi:sulfite reductase (NADPH) flavoprotein alpha-component
VVLHNNESTGYWLVLSGKVYDLTEFVNLHPGGKRILANNMGIDATAAYHAVLHHARPEVDSLLGLYEIGAIRRLQFGNAWAVGIGPNGLFYFTLEEAFTTWVRALYLVTEMENAIRSDFDFFERATTRDELHG